MQGKIVKFDNLGRGILYSNNKIAFIPKTCPGDIINYEIVSEHKSYSEGRLIDIITPSKMRLKSKCPYYDECGGCDLQHISYENTIHYKKDKITNLLNKNGYNIEPIVIKNINPYNYRNKISLKVIDGKIGLYKTKSNSLVEISNCGITNTKINDIIKKLDSLSIINGDITIRTNGSDVLLVINTKDSIKIDKLQVSGIILNNKLVYGNDTLVEEINGIKYLTSYDSFFQVNPYIASKLFEIITKYIEINDNILDLYCGVGAISLQVAKKAKYVTGVEIVENAIKNARENATMNNINNTKFILKDSSKVIIDLKDVFDVVIVDPPRSGLTKEICEYLNNSNAKKIIYVSCDSQTLFRDLKILSNNYEVNNTYLLDMFSYTEHCEVIVILNKK